VKEKQVESWKNSLFSFSAEEVVVLGSKQLEQEMKAFQEKFGSNWFQYFWKSMMLASTRQCSGKKCESSSGEPELRENKGLENHEALRGS